MDIRSLQYFLATAQEGSITKAAESLHLTQPTLSRQLKDLENELGKTLFIRGKKQITLTTEGILLRDRAEEILSLTQRAQQEIMQIDSTDISGILAISTVEYYSCASLISAFHELQRDYPGIHTLFSLNPPLQTLEILNQGVAELGIIHATIPMSGFDSICLHQNSNWGLLMHKDSPLAQKESLSPADLCGIPLSDLLYSREGYSNFFRNWSGKYFSKYQFVSTYCSYAQAENIAAQKLGYAFYFDDYSDHLDERLCFRPLNPPMQSDILLVWNRYRRLSRQAEKFIEILQRHL